MADAAHMSKPLTLSSELVPVTYAEALLQLAGELGVGREPRLGAAGLRVDFRPLYGNTPFNNWLLVARR